MAPGRGIEKAFVWLHQHAGVTQAPASHAAGVEDEEAVEQAQLQNTKAAQDWSPKILEDIPIRAREIPIAKAFAPFQHQDSVALLGPAHGRAPAAESGANHDEIEGFFCRLGCHASLLDYTLAQEPECNPGG